MIRLSSNMTLVLRIAIPVFYITFFGFLTLAVWLIDTDLWLFNLSAFKIGLLITYLITVLTMFFTIVRLKRVEYAEDYLYISDYFKNIRYHQNDIDQIKDYDFLLFTLVRITLKAKGKWGKHLYFVAKKSNYLKVKEFLLPH